MENKDISKNIKYYRKIKNLSQYQLAEKANIHEKTVTRAESGKTEITLKILRKIAKGLDIPLYRLFIPLNTTQNAPSKDIKESIISKLDVINKNKLDALDKIVTIFYEL